MTLTEGVKSYLKGIGLLIALPIIGILLVVLYFVYQSLYLLVLGMLLIVTIFIIPYFLGKKDITKAGDYNLKRVK